MLTRLGPERGGRLRAVGSGRQLGDQFKSLADESQVAGASEVKHRRVELRCGAYLFSEADNWYVPERLTPEMKLIAKLPANVEGRDLIRAGRELILQIAKLA